MSNYNLKINFIELADSDLQSSRTLYKSKNFHQSIFYLQQVSEKISKSHLLDSNKISEKDIIEGKKGLSHNTNKVYERVLHEQIDNIRTAKSKVYEINGINLESAIEGLNQFRFLKTSIHNLLEHEVISLIDLCNKGFEIPYSNLGININNKIDAIGLFKKNPEMFSSKALENTISSLEENEDLRDYLNFQFSLIIPRWIDYNSCLPAICFWSMVLLPHVSKTRYPCKENDFDPIKYYNLDHPLVKHYDGIYSIMSHCINKSLNYFIAHDRSMFSDSNS